MAYIDVFYLLTGLQRGARELAAGLPAAVAALVPGAMSPGPAGAGGHPAAGHLQRREAHPALGGAAIPAEEAGDITKIGQNRPKMAQTVAQNGQKCACSAIFGRPGLLSELCELLQGLQSIGAEAGEAALRLTAAFLDLRFGQSRQDATQLSQMPGLRGPNDTLILYEIYVYVIIIYIISILYIYLIFILNYVNYMRFKSIQSYMY